jgi:ABC-type phosphate transport system substrate-binding protein
MGRPVQAVELIAHPSLSERRLSQNEARALFYMRKHTWSDGLAVTIFVLNDDSDIHRNFSKQRLGLFPYRLRRVWDRHLYSGTGRIPEVVKNSREMVKRVASTPGAIGYAERESINEGVQIIEIR